MKLSQFFLQLQLFFLLFIALVAFWQRHRIKKGIKELITLDEAPLPEPPPHVSIILPVRNEEAHIDDCLASLLAQDYPDFEVVVIDDGSTDATPARLAEWGQRDPRLHVYRIEELPAGWAGKAHALHTGVMLTQGEWLLFTDADTRHAPQTLRRAVAHAIAHHLDLLTLFTDTRLPGAAARLLTAIGATLLAMLATPGEMRNPHQPTRVLAVGQYLLVRRSAYLACGGYSAPELRSTFSDDLTLAWYLKRHGCREDIVAERGLVFNDQWTTWKSAWEGMRKSNYGLVASSPLLGVVLGLALILYGLLPPVTLVRQLWPRRRQARQQSQSQRDHLSLLTRALAALALFLQIDTKRRFEREYRLPCAWSLTAPAGWVTFGLLMLDTTRLVLKGRGATWKGRTAPPQHHAVHPLAFMGQVLERLHAGRDGTRPFSCRAHYLTGLCNGETLSSSFLAAQRLSVPDRAGSRLAALARSTHAQGDAAAH
ncbi:MAG: glycosyltransferase [Thermogemmatispora sp.]|uniref:glycosyltransferase n=1 Tax=Thermogemmatispora sp. TaxID=1968838 RepID=UPI0019F02AFE|nr:glycosyltransferase family 2 protein [Thermogemmatispora sp.]MBE3567538.1 glycosyltransferase [Thermogemmatispora sp.]